MGSTDDRRTSFIRNKKERTRTTILNTAAKLFFEKGLSATSVAEIVSASGLGRATFYKHFPNKEAVLRALVNQVFFRIESVLIPISAKKDRKSMIKQVVSVMCRIIDAINDVLPIAKLFIGETEHGKRIESATITPFYQRLLEIAMNGVNTAKGFGYITNDLDTEVVARAFLGSFQAVILEPLSSGKISVEEAKRRAPVLIELYAKGLAGTLVEDYL